MSHLLLSGGLLVDGTGAPPRYGDLAVVDGRIGAVGADLPRAPTVLDVTGLVVCPGFVDVHTHSDLTLLSNPEAHSKIRQGVTTEIVGNCGLAPVPTGADSAALRAAVSYLDLGPGVAFDFTDMASYLDTVAQVGTSVNVGALVGHVPLRATTVGFTGRPATARELDTMCGLLAESLAAGALGLSTGLAYAPACYATDEELLALGRVVAAAGGLFAWHLRDYADNLIDSVSQALRVAERAGCRVQLSHLVAVGRRNWGAVRRALDLVEAVHANGVDVGVDIYPYLAGNAPLVQLLPSWAQDGGVSGLLARLSDRGVREQIRAELADQPLGWDEVTISSAPGAGRDVIGRSLAELAAVRGVPAGEVALDLLAEYGGAIDMVAYGRSEDDLRMVLTHPLAVIGSDGQSLQLEGPTGGGLRHPRSYGCYPRLLARYTGAGELDLAEAVAKATGRAAARVGLSDRGVVAPGLAADLVVFDPERIKDRATFASPHQYPEGIVMVIVNGEIVVHNEEHSHARPGAVLRAG